MVMLLILIITVILSAIVFGKLLYFDELWEAISGAILGAVLGFMIGIFVIMITNSIVSSIADKAKVISSVEEISALQDNIGVKGEFFLGSGQVNDTMKFYYIIKENNTIKIKSIDNSDYVTIEENASESPKIIHYKYEFNNKFVRNNFNPDSCYDVKIIIPKNSIKYDFNMDLK